MSVAALLVDVALMAPEYLSGAFNPVSRNGSAISGSVIGFITARQGTGGRG